MGDLYAIRMNTMSILRRKTEPLDAEIQNYRGLRNEMDAFRAA
jgi:hypothetical protein